MKLTLYYQNAEVHSQRVVLISTITFITISYAA